MFTLLALTIAVVGGRFVVKGYERHLDAQVGPWIAHDMQPQRIQARHSIDPR
jgi:hypothetical protein